ncbi:hypothetical protein MPDQ_002929 [Monascus purpureus]|uniref:Casein kinase II beta 2 subunit n=1 Tax=Monascus purpureus TaxID=5098 RepID=A0A507QJK3_MONPU|nr:hypothetical protein MPDQ_002929 [Monascus purpureus]BDD54828.1 hypothetical protein MAP00_000408 [Monascus purpureus]
MAPSQGHLLLPKLWRAAKFACAKAIKTAKVKLAVPGSKVSFSLQPAYARLLPRQPISRAAAIRQTRSRHFSTRTFVQTFRSGLYRDRAVHRAPSRVASNISRLTNRAPFASTLRPCLTGGTLCRTVGGYAVGAGRIGGARYFSHGAAAPAQVINNVSAGMRAFFLSGSKVRFDGIDPKTGNKRYKAVSRLQSEAERQLEGLPRTAPGSSIDFQISPTITAFGPLGGLKPASANACEVKTLNSEGLMDLLSVDFARALKDLAAVLNDLKRLATLGDLPIILQDRSTIRVRFPGCDSETVERLCDEVGVERGRISQDEDFEGRIGADLALLFPFAPSVAASPEAECFSLEEVLHPRNPEEVDWRAMMSSEDQTKQSSCCLPDSADAPSFVDRELFGDNPWVTLSSGYSSINISELGDRAFFPELSSAGIPDSNSDYDGTQGVYRFLAECDEAARLR